ncbi:MAG: hypothetical protein Q8L47_03430 [bacterium]|nr:hypothetical protein [bacterium]
MKINKDIWKISGLTYRVQRLIRDGMVLKGNEEKICEIVNREFSSSLPKGLLLTTKILKREISKLIWTKDVLEDLKKAIKHGIPLDGYREKYCSYVPVEMFKKKVKFLTGVSEAKAMAEFIAGMGRLSTEKLSASAELFEFPKTSYNHPYLVTASDSWTLAIPNGANIGLKHNRIIKDNPVRCALADAERRGDVVIVIANGLSMDLKKAAGPIKVYRAQVSGLHVTIGHLPSAYQAEARRIRKGKSLDEVIYMPMEAKFFAFLDAWFKITHRPNGLPEFSGKVLYVLGYCEEELINAAAYHEVRYITILKQKELDARIGFTKRKLIKAGKEEDHKVVSRCENELEALRQQRAMTIITNVSDEDLERRRRRIRALLVKKLEEMIPNCKVISQGSAFIKIGNSLPIEIHIPGNIRVTDNVLASYANQYGAKVFRDQMPRTVVICHPYALNHRLVGRDDYTEGQRDSSMVHVAPICVDEVFLRHQLKDSTRSVHPISKVLNNEQFKPGVLVLKCANGIISGDSFPIAKLDNTRNRKIKGFYPYPETKYIWTHVATDLHFGSRAREHVWDAKNKRYLGMAEASMEMMRREDLFKGSNMPVHIFAVPDDPTQGNHFDTHKQPDPREMSYVDLERYWSKAEEDMASLVKKGNTTEALQLMMSLGTFNLGQFLVRGLDWVQPQMLEVYARLINPNIDYYGALLNNTMSSKLVFRGLSEITGVPFDARDVGAITFGTGNHFERSVERVLTEGVFYAYYLRAMLGQLPYWQKRPDFIKRHVKAPLEGNAYFAEGTVKTPGGYEWALNFMSSPARLSSWADPLGAVVNNDRQRGDPFGHLKGRVALRIYGDKHFFAGVETPYSVYFMCAAHTHTDLYGHRGFPPNNTGVGFVGLPSDGPDSGPVLIRMLRYDFIRDWFKNPKPFNWKEFLPNPA